MYCQRRLDPILNVLILSFYILLFPYLNVKRILLEMAWINNFCLQLFQLYLLFRFGFVIPER